MSAARAALRLRVSLRGEDLAAISALEVLRENLGAEDLASLARETVWEIELPEEGAGGSAGAHGARRDAGRSPGAGSTSARGRLEAIARESLLFANPVKDRWALEEGRLRLPPAAPGRRVVGVLVRERPDRDGPACARALAASWGLGGAAVRRATLWLLDLADRGPEATAGRAREIAVTTRRTGGLLVNPHSQDYDIVEG